MTTHMNGVVEFFNNVKGWGKINGDDGNPYFVHHVDIVDKRFFKDGFEKFRTLKPGQIVQFEPYRIGIPGKMDAATTVTIVIDSNGGKK